MEGGAGVDAVLGSEGEGEDLVFEGAYLVDGFVVREGFGESGRAGVFLFKGLLHEEFALEGFDLVGEFLGSMLRGRYFYFLRTF